MDERVGQSRRIGVDDLHAAATVRPQKAFGLKLADRLAQRWPRHRKHLRQLAFRRQRVAGPQRAVDDEPLSTWDTIESESRRREGASMRPKKGAALCLLIKQPSQSRTASGRDRPRRALAVSRRGLPLSVLLTRVREVVLIRIGTIPKTTSGKIGRVEVRHRYLAGGTLEGSSMPRRRGRCRRAASLSRTEEASREAAPAMPAHTIGSAGSAGLDRTGMLELRTAPPGVSRGREKCVILLLGEASMPHAPLARTEGAR